MHVLSHSPVKPLLSSPWYILRKEKSLEKELEIVKEKISISEIAKDMEEMFSSSFSRAGKELKSDISENVYIQGNEALIRQLFSVIIENALKYSTTYAKLNLCSQGKSAYYQYL